jgi:hypothetical protein
MLFHELGVFPYPGRVDNISGRFIRLGDAFPLFPSSRCLWMRHTHLYFHFFVETLLFGEDLFPRWGGGSNVDRLDLNPSRSFAATFLYEGGCTPPLGTIAGVQALWICDSLLTKVQLLHLIVYLGATTRSNTTSRCPHGSR